MMNDPAPPRQQVTPAGQCEACHHARIVVTDRGSRFVRCGRADEDASFPRYPRLPMAGCPGYIEAPRK